MASEQVCAYNTSISQCLLGCVAWMKPEKHSDATLTLIKEGLNSERALKKTLPHLVCGKLVTLGKIKPHMTNIGLCNYDRSR